MTAKDVFKIGRLGKTHGVKGEVSFHFTDDVFDRIDADYVFVETEGLLVPFFFEEYRFRSEETALVKFAGIDAVEHVVGEVERHLAFHPVCLADAADVECVNRCHAFGGCGQPLRSMWAPSWRRRDSMFS